MLEALTVPVDDRAQADSVVLSIAKGFSVGASEQEKNTSPITDKLKITHIKFDGRMQKAPMFINYFFVGDSIRVF
jgi:hypothetical protein